MGKRMRFALLLLPLLAACGSPELMVAEPEPTDPPGPDEVKIVVYRESFRNATKPYAFLDEQEVLGFCQAGAWFEVLVNPGTHFFSLLGVSSSGVRADLAGGRTYFLRVDSVPKPFRLQLRLTPVIPGMEEFQEMDRILARLERRVPIEADRAEFAEEYADEIEEQLAVLMTDGFEESPQLRREDGR